MVSPMVMVLVSSTRFRSALKITVSILTVPVCNREGHAMCEAVLRASLGDLLRLMTLVGVEDAGW